MEPWNHDAGNINPENIGNSYIVTNKPIERFLKVGEHDRKLFLVGPKGTGKSLLIRYKAYKYFNDSNYKRYLSSPNIGKNELVESLDFNLGTLDKDDIKHLSKYDNWIKIWDFSLSLFILRKTGTEIPKEFKRFNSWFPLHFGLDDIVSELLSFPSKYIHSDFFNCIHRIKPLLKKIKSGYALFIDRLDQALKHFIKNSEYDYLVTEEINYPYEVWKGAQFALMVSIYNINSAVNSHIKIFATARTEALNFVENELKQNVESYAIELTYKKEELKSIFYNNIKLIPKENLVVTFTQNDFVRFLGFDTMKHMIAKDSKQKKPLEEKVFDFICRHSFERPRQIVVLGGVIYEQLTTRPGYKSYDESYKIEEVRRIVNDTAHFKILQEYKSELVPSFNEHKLKEFATQIEQNVITRELLEKIDEKAINYLYRLGLLGYLRSGRQYFLPTAKHAYNVKEKITNVDFYFLHPSLDKTLQIVKNFDEFYNPYNIIGNGYTFYPPPLEIKNVWNDKNLSYFLPKKIAGFARMNEVSKNKKTNCSLDDLYTGFYSQRKNQKINEFKDGMYKKGTNILSAIADLHLLSKLQLRFPSDPNLKLYEKKAEEKLLSYYFNNEYYAFIKTANNQEDLIKFGNRLIGRFISAGLWAYLKLEIELIKFLITNFRYSPGVVRNDQETVVKFFRTNFYLKNIKAYPPKNQDDVTDFLDCLSEHEQNSLKKWWQYYKHHDRLKGYELKENQLTFIPQILN